MRDALQVHGALARGVFAVVVLVSLAVLFAPGSDVPTAPPGADKVVHALLFAALALAGRWAGCLAAPLGRLLVGYALVSELVQGVTPLQRSASLLDVLADLVGIGVGFAVWAALGRRRPAAP
jgi:membrane associated rhomboid family serine protease